MRFRFLGLIISAALAAHAGLACTTREKRPHPDGVATVHAADTYVFSSLPEMVATTDAVIEGTVVNVRPGRLVNEGPGIEDDVQFKDVTIQINDVLFANGAATAALKGARSLFYEELGWDAGKPVVVEGVDQSLRGDRGFYFLRFKVYVSPPFQPEMSSLYWGLISSQGRYLIQPDNSLVGANEEDPLVQELEALSADEMRQQILQAARDIEAGTVEGQPRAIQCPPPGCVATEIGDFDIEVAANAGTASSSIEWECVARATGELANRVAISLCRIEDRGITSKSEDAPPVEAEGSAVGTRRSVQVSERWSDDTWICWNAKAYFPEGRSASNNDCKPW